MGWFLFVVSVGAIGAVAWWLNRRRQGSRQRELMLLCQEAGLEFEPLDLSLDTAWLPFPMFGAEPHGTENVVWQRGVNEDVRTFDYWFLGSPKGAARRDRFNLTCATAPLAFSAPPVRVAPRSFTYTVDDTPGGHEVHLDLEEFDRRFRVEAEDARFAFAFLDQRMMQSILGMPDRVVLAVNEEALLLWSYRLPAEQVLVLLEAAQAIRDHLPRDLPSLYPLRPERGEHEQRWLQGRWSPEPTGDPS